LNNENSPKSPKLSRNKSIKDYLKKSTPRKRKSKEERKNKEQVNELKSPDLIVLK
jgi:hypothetical protein